MLVGLGVLAAVIWLLLNPPQPGPRAAVGSPPATMAAVDDGAAQRSA